MVPSDFLARMNRLQFGSMGCVTSRTQFGMIESRTHTRGKLRFDPNEARSISGPKLLPPMPTETMSRMPWFLTELAKVPNSSVRSFMSSMMVSQPRRLAMSVGSCF